MIALDPSGGAELDAARAGGSGRFHLVLPDGATADLGTRRVVTLPDGGWLPGDPEPAHDAPVQRVAAGAAEVVLRLVD